MFRLYYIRHYRKEFEDFSTVERAEKHAAFIEDNSYGVPDVIVDDKGTIIKDLLDYNLVEGEDRTGKKY
ncbi:hypothetical protein ACIQLG_19790 [Terribacillus saccharophilus]|uniref:hypothetical protein n=1 Tax=Terribacillus saccharophilus TaxID=361277 RepID=UPI00381C21F3